MAFADGKVEQLQEGWKKGAGGRRAGGRQREEGRSGGDGVKGGQKAWAGATITPPPSTASFNSQLNRLPLANRRRSHNVSPLLLFCALFCLLFCPLFCRCFVPVTSTDVGVPQSARALWGVGERCVAAYPRGLTKMMMMMMITAVISIARYLTVKGEHISLYRST